MKKHLLFIFTLIGFQALAQLSDPVNTVTSSPAPAVSSDSVFQVKASSRAALLQGEGSWVVAGGSSSFDGLVGMLTDGVGTNPVLWVWDDFESYVIDTVYSDDTGIYMIKILGYNYGNQDDLTYLSATNGVASTPKFVTMTPLDNFGDSDNSFLMIEVYDETGVHAEIEGYIYFEMRIYPSVTTVPD